MAFEDSSLGSRELRLDGRIIVEIQPQVFVDTLIHPVFRLLVATIVEIAVGLHEIDILVIMSQISLMPVP